MDSRIEPAWTKPAVEQDVGIGQCDAGSDAVIIANIQNECLDIVVVQFGEGIGIDVSGKDLRAFFGHGQGRGPSDALGGCCDQRAFSAKAFFCQ